MGVLKRCNFLSTYSRYLLLHTYIIRFPLFGTTLCRILHSFTYSKCTSIFILFENVCTLMNCTTCWKLTKRIILTGSRSCPQNECFGKINYLQRRTKNNILYFMYASLYLCNYAGILVVFFILSALSLTSLLYSKLIILDLTWVYAGEDGKDPLEVSRHKMFVVYL